MLKRVRLLLKLMDSTPIPPSGDLGNEELLVSFDPSGVRVDGHYAEGAEARIDWHNDRLQILVFDQSDEPALHVRYNRDGTIAEVIIRADLMAAPSCGPIVKREGEPQTEWAKERDAVDPVGESPKCRYEDCHERHSIASDEEEVTCPTCRKTLGL